MITRREMVAGVAGSLLLGDVVSRGKRAVAAEAAEHELIALPGKVPLIKRTYRPPNFETPLANLRSEFTANDAFFVRYHLANIPEVDPKTWRLRAGGESATRMQEWSLDDLKRSFKRVSVAAINQCSGIGVACLRARRARVVAQLRMQLAVADVDRDHTPDAVLEQVVGEAARRGADVDRVPRSSSRWRCSSAFASFSLRARRTATARSPPARRRPGPGVPACRSPGRARPARAPAPGHGSPPAPVRRAARPGASSSRQG